MSALRLCSVCTTKAKRASCCNALLCAKDSCASSHARVCMASKALLAADPKAWRKANAKEASLTSAVVKALNALPGFDVWHQKEHATTNTGKESKGVADVIGWRSMRIGGSEFSVAVALGVETKNSHPDACACPSCEAQRAWGSRLKAAGGVYVRARSVAEAMRGLGVG